MRRPPSIRTIRYFLPASSNGVAMSGKWIIVPDHATPPVSSGDSLILKRRDFAALLRFWRRTDTSTRRVKRQERINALILFLIRNTISR